jgi:hypothetical protein
MKNVAFLAHYGSLMNYFITLENLIGYSKIGR